VEDDVDRLLELEMLGQVVVSEHQLRRADVLDVLQAAGVEIVDADDPVALPEQVVAEMGSDEPRPAGDDSGGHDPGS
jgi:hypothetical protein